jgi:hypothetical protein
LLNVEIRYSRIEARKRQVVDAKFGHYEIRSIKIEKIVAMMLQQITTRFEFLLSTLNIVALTSWQLGGLSQ